MPPPLKAPFPEGAARSPLPSSEEGPHEPAPAFPDDEVSKKEKKSHGKHKKEKKLPVELQVVCQLSCPSGIWNAGVFSFSPRKKKE